MSTDGASENSDSTATSPLRRQARDHAELRTQFEAWLAKRLPDLGPLQIGAIQAPDSSGVANETLLMKTQLGDAAGPDLVLRLEGDEFLYLEADLALHYEMYAQVGSMGSVPVPEVLAFEDDRSVLGTRFMLMRRVPGQSVPDRPNFNYAGWLYDMSPGEQESVWREAVVAMAELHNLDVTKFFGLQAKRSSAGGLADCFDYWCRYAKWCGGGVIVKSGV